MNVTTLARLGVFAAFSDVRCFEFCWLGGDEGPTKTTRLALDGSRALHFAPHRWLLPLMNRPALEELEALQSAGDAALIDVDTKWQRIARVDDSQPSLTMAQVLGTGLDLESLLEGRQCVAATPFDCPSIIARDQSGLAVWTLVSYAQHFVGILNARVLKMM